MQQYSILKKKKKRDMEDDSDVWLKPVRRKALTNDVYVSAST